MDEHICVTEIEKVASCPVTEQEYNEAARRKKCSSIKSTCTNEMVQLEYHCLPNAWGNKFFEMCATSEEIIGTLYAGNISNNYRGRFKNNFEKNIHQSVSNLFELHIINCRQFLR